MLLKIKWREVARKLVFAFNDHARASLVEGRGRGLMEAETGLPIERVLKNDAGVQRQVAEALPGATQR